MKRLLSFIVLSLLVSQGFSQKLSLGVSAGVNSSTFQSKESSVGDFKYKLGYQISAIVGYNFSEKIGVRVEPGFANRGSMISNSGFSDYKVNLNYLTAPILLRYSPFDKISILAGPEMAYRLSAKSTVDGKSTDITTFYNSNYDMGVTVGLSYHLMSKLDLGMRYNRGFISTMKDMTFTDQYGNVLEKVKLCNQGFSFSVAYMLK